MVCWRSLEAEERGNPEFRNRKDLVNKVTDRSDEAGRFAKPIYMFGCLSAKPIFQNVIQFCIVLYCILMLFCDTIEA